MRKVHFFFCLIEGRCWSVLPISLKGNVHSPPKPTCTSYLHLIGLADIYLSEHEDKIASKGNLAGFQMVTPRHKVCWVTLWTPAVVTKHPSFHKSCCRVKDHMSALLVGFVEKWQNKIAPAKSSFELRSCASMFDIPECSEEMFRCADGMCIPKIYVCNGNRDCGDASDETSTNCREFLFCDGTHYIISYILV